MGAPWDRLGLAGFRAVFDGETAVFESGRPSAGLRDTCDTIPWIVYGEADHPSEGIAYDARLLARILHPTLPDHELETICALHEVQARSGRTARGVGEAFAALVLEATQLDREVVALIARLAPAPLSELFSRALVLPLETPTACVGEPATPTMETEPRPAEHTDPFAASGFIARTLPAYEHRAGQVRMAREVGRVLRDGGALVVEAGPGTGKTFAYLIPAIEHLVRERSARVVVSTRTKQLQEQLFGKDLPFLLEQMCPDLKVALLKGRENYLCLRRWEIVVRELSEGLERDRLSLLAPLVRWLWDTETGDIDENTAFLADPNGRELWRRLCDSSHHCIDSVCPHLDDCFSIRARRRARKADLVVVNHSLLLNDLTVDRLVLGKYTHAVIDEAHALEETARSAFTSTLSSRIVEHLADELTPSRRRRVGWLDRLALPRNEPGIRAAYDLVGALRTGTARLFSDLGRRLPKERRGTLPDLDNASAATLDRIATIVGRLETSLEELVDEIEEPELKREGEGHVAMVRDLGTLLARLAAPPEEDAVRWYERERSGLSLHVTPLEVAPVLARALYPALEAVVLTSATLSVDKDFGFILRAVGLDLAFDDIDTEVVASPFSYEEHMRICVPASLPFVTEDSGRYEEALAALLVALAGRIERKGLVLFTSYKMLEGVRRRLPDGLPSLSQGIDGPRSKLIERFKRFPRGILLLGTDSFWEGVDLPGEELEYVVISRLPFDVPTDPIQAALGEHYARIGRDPFRDLALPRAVLKLRQGVGRLIRTRQDRGVVILTDRRVLARGYGRSFTAALPASVEIFDAQASLVDEIADWFGGAKRGRSPSERIDLDGADR